MKKILITLISAICTFSSVLAGQNKILVTFFSRAGENWEVGNVERGNTAIIGEYIQQLTNADIFEIEPVVPYPVDYYETIEVARKESSKDARPQIKGELPDLSEYETVIIGSPIWNGAPPMIMHTFYEALPELAEKTLVPFGTHGGSGVASCTSLIKKYFPSAEILAAFGMSGSAVRNEDAKDKVEKWLNDIGILPLSEEETTYQAIDLGLSVKWADCNVGATVPEEYGGLYGWGDPTGTLTSETIDDYPSANPPASICGTEYDIATAKWGKDWRMPTQAECEELATKCTWEWTTVNGINGMTVTGTNGNSIFLPAGATRTGVTVSNQVGQRGNYWSGTLWPDNTNFASYLYFYSDATRVQPARSNRRYIGMSIRPVFNDEGAGVNDVRLDEQREFSVIINGSSLQVYNLSEGTPILVYDIMGKTIYTGKEHQVNLTKSGVYLIRANNITKKVFILKSNKAALTNSNPSSQRREARRTS